MKAIKDNAVYIEKKVIQDSGDTDFAKVTDTTVNYVPNEIPLLDTTTNTQLESVKKLTENDEVLLTDTNNNIAETKLGSVTTGTIDTTQTLDVFNDNSCIATYTFDNETAEDLSSNHNGTWGGTEAYEDGKFGKVAKFNGSSEINCGKINTNLDELWISFWMYWNGNYDEMPIGFYRYELYISDDGYFCWNTGNYDRYGIDFPTSKYANKWLHIVVNFKTGNYGDTMYINSIKQNLSQKKGSIKSSSATIKNVDLHIAGWGSNNNYRFKDLIDQVRIFNRALTDDEVKQLYKEQKVKYIGDISSANLENPPTKAFKKQLPSVSIAIEATEADITDASFNELTPKTTTYDGSKFTTVYATLGKEGRVIQRKLIAPKSGMQILTPFTSNLYKKDA